MPKVRPCCLVLDHQHHSSRFYVYTAICTILHRLFMTNPLLGVYRTCYRATTAIRIPINSKTTIYKSFSSSQKAMSGSDAAERAIKPSVFSIINKSFEASSGTKARTGNLELPGRQPIQTPNFLANTSRGVIPHISPDAILPQAPVPGVFTAIEDCMCCLVDVH